MTPLVAFDRAFARLTQQAAKLAGASAAVRALSQRQDPARWRKARLLWPLFTKG